MPYGRVTFNGSLASGAEDWSTGFNFGGPIAVTDPLELFPLLQGAADGIRDGLGGETGYGSILTGGIGPNGTVTSVGVSWRDETGELIMAATSVFSTPLEGSGSSNQPLSNALVVTTLSGLPGARYRGRMFIPATAYVPGSVGRFSATTVSDAADNARALIVGSVATLRNELANTSIEPIIWSKTLGAGTTMRQISVGDVPDVMRRRRDRLTENRQTRDVLSEPTP